MSGTATVSKGRSLESGSNWEIARDGNGVQSIKVVDSGFADTGTYRIDGYQICSKWQKIRDGSETCSALYALPDSTYEAADGKGVKLATFIIEKAS